MPKANREGGKRWGGKERVIQGTQGWKEWERRGERLLKEITKGESDGTFLDT